MSKSIWVVLMLCATALAQESAPADDSTTVFPHAKDSWWYVAGQMNFISQGHPEFSAPYSGPNSLNPRAEIQTSRVMTLFTGAQLGRWTEVLFDAESTGGRGIGDALGLAGFTNLDVVRNPSLGPKPYVARVMIHQFIPLSSETEEAERNFLSLATKVPIRRIEVHAGRFSLADFLDQNSVGSDSHLQFLNWTVDNNGGWDYAADTRGYTWGIVTEYHDRNWSARFAEALMPKVANGLDMDWNLRRAHSENYELELRPKLLKGRPTVFRVLSYVNHANMGSYREAIDQFLAHRTAQPDVTATRRQGRVKYGFGGNVDQSLTKSLRVFGRFGWNEGANESFAYTEVNQTIEFGADHSGEHWGRKLDRVGAAFVLNAISGDHRRYLALGGHGFLLGDGHLNYGRERIFEAYYTAHLWRGVFASADLQHITNPGYNRDRGPVLAPGLRLHIDF